MDRFEELSAFVRVAETGSFTAAAEQLDLAKSAVSRRVADLEARLRVQLFRRTTRKLNLTDSGRGFLEHARRILEDLAEAEARVVQAHGELKGSLKVALPMSFGLRHLSPALCEFGRAHPGIRFDIDFNDRRVDLLQDGFDLAVRIGNMEDSSLIARRLFDARTIPCASPLYLDKHGVPESPADLARHSALVYSNVPEPERWSWYDDAGRRHTIKVNAVLRANSGEYLGEAAIAGHGITLQPTFIAFEPISRGELVPVLPNVSWPVSQAWAVYPPTRHLSRRVRTLIDFLAERFAGVPYWDREIASAIKG